MGKRLVSSTFALIILSLSSLAQVGVPRIVINSLGHSAKIQNLNYTPDGDKIISVSEDKTVRIWNASTGDMLKKFESQIGDGSTGMLYASAVSPDGTLLAIAGYTITPDNQVYIAVIDINKGIQVATALGHTNVVNSLAFTGNGKYLVSGSDDATVKVWSVNPSSTSYKEVITLNAGAPVKYLAMNPVTMDVAAVVEGKNEITVYSLAMLEKGGLKFNPRFWHRHRGEVNKIAFSPDGTYFASSSQAKEFFLWRADGSFVKDLSAEQPINAIAFSHDAKILVGLDVAGHGVSYGVPGGNKFTDFNGHDNTVMAAVFSPQDNGSYVVASAGGNNNEIYQWNPINGKTIRKVKGKGSAIQNLAFGAGLELFISQDVNAKEGEFKRSFDFNLMKLNPTAPKFIPPAQDFNRGISQSSETKLDLPKNKAIENSPDTDGRILDFQGTQEGNVIVASDFSLRMYDRNGFFQKDFVGHNGSIRSVTVSADGRYLASGGEDQTIILWKLNETGAAPSLRQAFPDASWANFFSSLPVDSLTREPSKKAWRDVIDFLKSNGDKTYKGIEEVYKNLGESVLPFATLFITEDNEWVCWAHKGFFSCTSSGSQYFGWHVNRGIDKLADFYTAEQYFEVLYRPKQMEKSISQGRRVEDILREEGERIFDLSKLHRPSAGFFTTEALHDKKLIDYQNGKLVTVQKQLPLEVEIYDGGSGVKEVNIFQNDKLIISDHEVKTNGEGEKVTKTYNVDLLNETNEFKVIVTNYQRVESRGEVLKIEYVGQVIATSSLHMLVVGINKYSNSSYNLNYAQPDAKAFADKMVQQSERIFKSINKVEIYDEQATKPKIVEAFKSIAAKAQPQDVFVFFYAGHGSLDEENKDKEGDAPFYFVPTDVTKLYGDTQQLQARGISDDELKNYLTKIRSTKQIVLMDACHSGAALKGMKTRAVAGDEKAMVQLARSSGVVMIASAGSKQLAVEFDVLKHGAFTYALLEALEGKEDNGDGKITVNELKFHMEERVPELTKQYGGEAQYPTGFMRGNDFPISVYKKD
ncbi:MAG: caspase family protein [Bacteroidota bacterium]